MVVAVTGAGCSPWFSSVTATGIDTAYGHAAVPACRADASRKAQAFDGLLTPLLT